MKIKPIRWKRNGDCWNGYVGEVEVFNCVPTNYDSTKYWFDCPLIPSLSLEETYTLPATRKKAAELLKEFVMQLVEEE